MSKNFIQSRTLKTIGMFAYRLRARLTPDGVHDRVYINSFPKAGTHLMTSILGRLPDTTNSYLHIKTRDMRQRPFPAPFALQEEAFRKSIATVRRGQFFTGHLPYDPRIVEILSDEGIRIVNIERDPRDILLSMCHYIIGLRRHPLHAFLMAEYPDFRSRLHGLILGPKKPFNLDFPFPPFSTHLEDFVGWKDAEKVLTLSFENLVGARGGGSAFAQTAALEALFAHLGRSDLDKITSISAQASGVKTATLRKGKIGEWRDSFDVETCALCQREFGSFLARTGYEPWVG
jgi:hypothetical protein